MFFWFIVTYLWYQVRFMTLTRRCNQRGSFRMEYRGKIWLPLMLLHDQARVTRILAAISFIAHTDASWHTKSPDIYFKYPKYSNSVFFHLPKHSKKKPDHPKRRSSRPQASSLRNCVCPSSPPLHSYYLGLFVPFRIRSPPHPDTELPGP